MRCVTSFLFVAVSLIAAGTAAGQPPVPTAIAWQSTRDGNSELYIANPDGTLLTNLTRNAAKDTYPSISPDGAVAQGHGGASADDSCGV